MKLQGRELSIELKGEDVALLQKELMQLGFEIADTELKDSLFGETTQKSVIEFQQKNGLKESGVVDEATATAINQAVEAEPRQFIVRGQIRQADGNSFEGGMVRAFDKDLRSEELLGEVATSNGQYEITYTAESFSRAEKKNADLIVRVWNREGVLLKESPILFNAPAVATVDLVIGEPAPEPSEYERHMAELVLLLEGQDVSFSDLQEDKEHQDISFLSGETGIDARHVTLLVLSARLARRELSPEVFYGLFRQNLPTDLTALLAASPKEQRQALDKSLSENIIPSRLHDQLDNILEALQHLYVEHAFEPREEKGRYSLGEVLSTSLLSRDLLTKFLDLYIRREGPIAQFWQSLSQNPDFADGRVHELQATLQLGLLTGSNAPLVKRLQDLRSEDRSASLRDLAKKLNAQELTELLNSTEGAIDGIQPWVVGETTEEKITNYVNGIMDTLQVAFPATFVSLGIAKSPEIHLALVNRVLANNPELDPAEPLPEKVNWTGITGADQERARASLETLRQEIRMFPAFDYKRALTAPGGNGSSNLLLNTIRQGVAQFFTNEPNFEFAETHIDNYLAEHAATAFNGIAEKDRPAVTNQLKALQRVSRVAPRYGDMETLMGEGLDSAFAISSMPQKMFVEMFSKKLGGDDQAHTFIKEVGGADEADAVYSQAKLIHATNTTAYTSFYQAIHDNTPFVIGGPSDAVKQNPNLTNLFGRMDFCDCDDCRSVYSPAAYFVDLLHFLDAEVWKAPEPGQRRPIEVLLDRRPDLQHIKLNCENTNTVLPYADLVNEILEYYVAHGALDAVAAKNTEAITAAELGVNPQYTIDAAYDILKNRIFPFALPFDRSLQVARVYLEHLGSRRYQVMQTFQKDQAPSDLEIACEYLNLSPKEYQIVTGFTPPQQPATVLHQYYGYVLPTGWQEDIAHVTEFMKRTSIHYVDLVELLKTRFLNGSKSLRLGVIAPNTDQLIELCDLSQLKINNLADAALDKLHRFIRLWRKLGWSIQELDKVLATLGVTDLPSNVQEQRLLLEQLLQNLVLVKRLQAELKLPLVSLLSFWADIDSDGKASLYLKLFQNKAVLNPPDDAFALRYIAPLANLPSAPLPDSLADKISYDPTAGELCWIGNMSEDERPLLLSLSPDADYHVAVDSLFEMRWSEGTELAIAHTQPDQAVISNHTHAILAALRINAADLTLLREALGLADEDAPLTLANLSQVYRHALLAKALKLKVKDLLVLKALIGIDPLALAAPASTAAFLQKVGKVKPSGFTVAQLNYLYRHVAEPPQTTAPAKERLLLLAKGLHDELRGIAEENQASLDPNGELTRKKLAIIWESATVDQMISLLDGSARYSAPLAPALVPPEFPAPVSDKIAYDSTNALLRFTGGMTLDEQAILLPLSADSDYQAAVNSLFQQPRDFLLNTKAGFLDLADAVAALLDTAALGKQEKFAYILERLLPYLRNTLSRSLVKQTFADWLKLDSAAIDLLLETVLKSPVDANKLMMEDLLAMGESGLTGEYYSDEQFVTPALTRLDRNLAFDGVATTPETTIPEVTRSARWQGLILAPNNGDYTFCVRASGGVQLWVGDSPQPILDAAQNQSLGELDSKPISLRAGQLYELRLQGTQLAFPAVVELCWSSSSMPKDLVSSSNLYPSSIYNAFALSSLLLHKVALLVNTLKMTSVEIAYLSSHGTDFGGVDPLDPTDSSQWMPFDLNRLPLDPSAFTPALFDQWARLVDLIALRESLPSVEVGLVDVFEAASASADPNTLSQAVGAAVIGATGWDPMEFADLAGEGGFGLLDSDFKNEVWLLRLQASMKLSRRLGVSTVKLFNWASQPPDTDQAHDIVETVKAKYEDEEWLSVGKPLNDLLRESQKAALIASALTDPYIIQKGIVASNQLFAHFLIDVDMGTCMTTSRIKQAISSVQLFIQRCLMNLEHDENNPPMSVSPLALDAELLEPMKNYRVWEANRKVFLYPENWIEPELRDDKSPFFKELESELLQNDITVEAAERALQHYLEKLDEITHLQVCGIYWQKKESGDEPYTDILHVFARTPNTPHMYFYRRLLVTTHFWTGWEKVALDIEGDDEGVHLMPVVYNRRLYLFWPLFAKKNDSTLPSPDGVPATENWEIRLAWSEYRQNAWSPKQVSGGSLVYPEVYYKEKIQRGDFAFSTSFANDVLTINAHRTQDSQLKGWQVTSSPIFGYFWMDECGGELRSYQPQAKTQIPCVYYMPYSSNKEYLSFRQLESASQSDIPDEKILGITTQVPVNLYAGTQNTILRNTASRFELLHPHQLNGGWTLIDAEDVLMPLSQSFYPFFYRDVQRTYCAIPRVSSPILWFADAEKLDPAFLALASYSGDNEQLSGLLTKELGNGHVPATMTNQLAPAQTSTVMAKSGGGAGPYPTRDPVVIGNAAAVKAALQLGVIDLVTHLQILNFFHPHICTWFKRLNQKRVPGLLTLANQKLTKDLQFTMGGGVEASNVFESKYNPNPGTVFPDYPEENVDFSRGGAFSLYNWELFFHAPMLIATLLSQNQKFEQAREWFHYIFNPTDSSSEPSPQRYWRVLPFYQNAHPEKEQIQALLTLLSTKDSDLTPQQKKEKQAMIEQVEAWRENPFNPYLLGRMRITAFQKNVVMKYIDSLLAWGDLLFSRPTIESINKATLLYILAANMLGPRPEQVPAMTSVQTETYATLKVKQLDPFSNALVQMETEFPVVVENGSTNISNPGADSVNLGTTFYFCIPPNGNLLKYWDTVEDRLFKIRHCLNIEGVAQQLPLFEPPIDPAILVRAFAKGVDISSVLNDMNAPLPHYRFSFMFQKAVELCAELKGLGSALLSALEKKDAEELAATRATHEKNVLEAVREVRRQQVAEATAVKSGLVKTREQTKIWVDFYGNIPDRIPEESSQLTELDMAKSKETDSQSEAQTAADIAGYTPDATVGFSGISALTSASFGRANVIAQFEALSRRKASEASDHTYAANLAGIRGTWARRGSDWKVQFNARSKELEQIDQQIVAQDIRIAVAERELTNLEQQIEDAAEVESFLRDKYTNQELYTWMVAEVSKPYFQAYKLAYDIAKRAERAYRFELGLTDSDFIQFGYWDSLRKGLLSGERLYLDLKRMEIAYLDKNRREYEITKHISLLLHDPLALISLKETGQCEIFLPEAVFDADYPGHYRRRIKSVSLTIPCVAGPYTSINCTLTLLSNKVRIDNNATGYYAEQEEDTRFVTNFAAMQSIATSHAQNDSGMFELNFRDERYLPFEGAGVISRWRIELPKECNAFDFDTISDVIMKFYFNAREGGESLRKKAIAEVVTASPKTGIRLFSAKHEFSTEWHRFLHSLDPTTQKLQLTLTLEQFPFQFKNKNIEINSMYLFLKLKDGITYDDDHPLTFDVKRENGTEYLGQQFEIVGGPIGDLPYVKPFDDVQEELGRWSITVTGNGTSMNENVDPPESISVYPESIEDIWIVLEYSATS